MPDYLDDFVCGRTCEEYYPDDDEYYDYRGDHDWYDVEAAFFEQMGIEPEVYED